MQEIKQEQFDFSVFEQEYDIHKRGQQCINTINAIEKNRLDIDSLHGRRPHQLKKQKTLTALNRTKLLEYAQHMITLIKRKEFSFSSFEKDLDEAWIFCLYLDKDIDKITKDDLLTWWNNLLKNYENGNVSWATIGKKQECARHFLKWLNGLKRKQRLELFDHLELPRKPKNGLQEEKPSQGDIKKLLDSAYIEGKRYTIRDRAILALLNDCGCRIGEALSIRNKNIRKEKNYLVVSFPESKTTPRTVISFLAKSYLEEWAKISPNKNNGPEAFFFCQEKGEPVNYASVVKTFKCALKKSGINWKKGKGVHYFRSLFSSRAINWPYTLKHAFLGWAFKDHEKSYTNIDHAQFTETYFQMLKEENNPMLGDELPFWEKQDMSEKMLTDFLQSQEGKYALRQWVRKTNEGQ